MFSVTILF